MDELLKDFLTESSEQLGAIDSQLVRFEREPSDARIVANVFRLVHMIKSACGCLNLQRLEKVAHSAEILLTRLRDCEFRRNPATDSDLKPATVPI
jgi:two-component system chemotaxis sensor kinase CheA